MNYIYNKVSLLFSPPTAYIKTTTVGQSLSIQF
jgi:hypothetical protein